MFDVNYRPSIKYCIIWDIFAIWKKTVCSNVLIIHMIYKVLVCSLNIFLLCTFYSCCIFIEYIGNNLIDNI